MGITYLVCLNLSKFVWVCFTWLNGANGRIKYPKMAEKMIHLLLLILLASLTLADKGSSRIGFFS